MTRAEASILDSPRDGPALPDVWVRIPYGETDDSRNFNEIATAQQW